MTMRRKNRNISEILTKKKSILENDDATVQNFVCKNTSKSAK